ncbi:dihydroorotate dehydrogenase B (NAD(+)), catalytic subunit [Actinomycetes bacterium]|nr:dihydroorotate dehydrogenase B (NAD(+)), catalytic subunit [Actinomycetes bacterium]
MASLLALPMVRVGSVELPSPVILASGTAGHSDELAAYMDLSVLGAVVVKSVASFEWQGNPAPRLHALSGGMINAVGLQGRGVEQWIAHDLPRLRARNARVVASIWGFRESEYEAAALALSNAASGLVAVEVNLSCPNVEHARSMFAHDAVQSSRVVAAVRRALPHVPVWAKLSPNTDRLVEIAGVVSSAGADALVLVNTVLGMAIDTDSRQPVLGNGGGGVSGAAMHAVAVRSVFDVRAALSDVPIIGVGGVSCANDALELMMAGANAVQVGTATFADPRAAMKIQRDMLRWAHRRDISSWEEITGSAH